jgi:hypothetical protein
MQNKFKWVLGLLLVLGIIVESYSQDKIGSPYTRYGIGDLMSRSFGDSKAMGGTSLALQSGNKLNVSNPASYTSIDSLRFIMEIGLTGAYKTMQSGNQTAAFNDFTLDYLSFGFPITKWWGAAIGLLPYSNVGYDLVSSEIYNGYNTDFHYLGTGGINQVLIGNSFEPFENLSVGVNLNYLFGSIHRNNSVEFERDDTGLLNIYENNSMYFSDFYFSFGGQYIIHLNKNHRITLGAVWENNTPLNTRRYLLVTNSLTSNNNPIDTLYFAGNETGKVTLPMSLGGGIAYHYSDKLTFAFDYYIQDWSESLIFGESDSLGNSQRVSFGGEWIPAGINSPGLKYWEKVKYRAGVYYNDTYLQFNQGETKIKDFGIGFGLGLPMKRSNTTFNISFEIGQRGTLENNFVKEQYAILGMNFSLSDIWFVKRKFD